MKICKFFMNIFVVALLLLPRYTNDEFSFTGATFSC